MVGTSSLDPVAQSLLGWAEAVGQGALAQDASRARLEAMRLEDLVLGLLDLDDEEAARIDALSSTDSPFGRSPEHFCDALLLAIREMRLSRLFARTRDGEHHRSICPAAYDERTGEHHPAEMARWRTDFRAMSPEQQMMATTIVWMYRAGPDSIWLRRVPCTWKASEALYRMHDAGCLGLWLRLVARYPRW